MCASRGEATVVCFTGRCGLLETDGGAAVTLQHRFDLTGAKPMAPTPPMGNMVLQWTVPVLGLFAAAWQHHLAGLCEPSCRQPGTVFWL